MKHFLPFAATLLALSPMVARAQVGVGTTTPDAKSALDIRATDKGLLIPRLTAAQRTAITSPPQGLMVYQTDGSASGGPQTGFWYYAGAPAQWVFLNPAASGDNLGNHTATQNLNLTDKLLVGGTAASPGTQGLKVDAAGRVGVGLGTGVAPTEQLQVDGGSAKIGLAQWATTADDRLLKFGDGGFVTLGETGGDDLLQLQAKDFRFNPSGSGGLGYSGNVGIGLGTGTAASERLEVAGSIKMSGTAGTDGLVFPDGTRQTTAVSTSGGLTLPYSGTANAVGNVFSITNSGSGIGVRGASASGQGVVGRVNGTGAGQGVVGVKGTTVPNIANGGVVGLADVDPAVYAASNSSSAVVATTNGSSPTVAGVTGSSTGAGMGVQGTSIANSGVYGVSSASNATVAGVQGVSNASSSGVGVLGQTTNGFGVRGIASANGGYGVNGLGTGASGYGVAGQGSSGATGVYGLSPSGTGVLGSSTSGSGVEGSSSSGSGVLGSSASNAAGTAGVEGSNSASGGVGVLGVGGSGSNGTGVLGQTVSGYGVRGEATGSNGSAVFGRASNSAFAAVYGQAYNSVANAVAGEAFGSGRAGFFNQANSSSTSPAVEIRQAGTAPGLRVAGTDTTTIIETSSTTNPFALKVRSPRNYESGIFLANRFTGRQYTEDWYGTIVLNQNTLKFDVGPPGTYYSALELSSSNGGLLRMQGQVMCSTLTALYGTSNVVNLNVNGMLYKAGGSFKIDHPLDPAHQYLSHSFVESPDMMNVYNGNVVLDARGEATVALPDYFEALNRDFRYQLTPIGAPGPNLYVAQEVQGLRFRIAGGSPGGKVSWQVTGIRQDKWANQNRIKNAEIKEPENQGKYLHPEAFGQPAARGIGYQEPRPAASASAAPAGSSQHSTFTSTPAAASHGK